MPYQMILLDPPWPETGGSGRGAQNHYDVIKSKEEMIDVISGSGVFLPHANCHMMMWVTNNYMPWGLWIMTKLGFSYKTMITWAKESRGTGYYFAGQTEHLMFGVRGTLAPRLKAKHTTLLKPSLDPSRFEHSRKPQEAYDLAEDVGFGPRLEMFSRNRRPGWSSWGHGIDPDLPLGHVYSTNESGLTDVVKAS